MNEQIQKDVAAMDGLFQPHPTKVQNLATVAAWQRIKASLSPWQPIETAPKDRRVLVGRTAIKLDDHSELPAYWTEAQWSEDLGAFCFTCPFKGEPARAHEPTHYFLPAPPEVSS